MTRFVLALSLGAMAGLAACASEQPPAREHFGGGRGGHWRQAGGPGGRGGGPARRLNIFISPEGKPYRGKPGEPYAVAVWFAEADRDHDGKLTQAEFRQDAEGFFKELDTNHDGLIDGFELSHYEQEVAPEILPRFEGLRAGEGMDQGLDVGDPRNTGRPRGRRGGGMERSGGSRGSSTRRQTGEPLQGAALFGLLNEPEPVADADTSFDQKITLAEFLAAADRRFELLDTKKQGYLVLSELPKTPVQALYERASERAKARDEK